MNFKLTLTLLAAIFLTGCQHTTQDSVQNADIQPALPSEEVVVLPQDVGEGGEYTAVDFTDYDDDYQFKALVPPTYKIEYVDAIESINIYDPQADGDSIIDKSQIFIRKFTANTFLTLNTVDILSREEKIVGRHKAVLYDIQKKQGVPDFPDQPKWRNERHKVLDIRYAETNPSVFFVFSYNPQLEEAEFQKFIDSLVFYNDRESFRSPLDHAENRVTKKPFGIYITPENSPVQPEKFTGYHTGTDFEIYEEEMRTDVPPVLAICGGVIKERKRINGYGGVIIQECMFGDQPVRVLYGHVSLDDMFALRPIGAGVGTYMPPGRIIAKLGDDKSEDTDGERKHLHLGIINGTVVDVRGYVANKEELENWLDFYAEEDLFLAKRDDSGKNITIIRYSPSIQKVLSKQIVSLDDAIGRSSTNMSGATDAVQFNQTTGDVFIFTHGASDFGGECINKDGSCFDRIFKAKLDSPKEVELLFQGEQAIHHWQLNSVDNSLVVLFGGDTLEEGLNLIVLDAMTKKARISLKLGKAYYSLSPITISRDGMHVYIIKKAEKGETPVIMKVELKTGHVLETEIAPGVFDGYSEISLSPDGRLAAFYNTSDLYIYDIQSKQVTQVLKKAKIANYNLLWTGDSKKLFYILDDQFAYFDIQSKKIYKISEYEDRMQFTPYTISSSPSGRYVLYDDAKEGFTLSVLDISVNKEFELSGRVLLEITAAVDIVGTAWSLEV